jgi:histone H3/H4
MEFSVGGMKNILHDEDPHKQVTRDAAIALNDALEKQAEEVAEIAVILTYDRGRVTVKEKDIRDSIRFLEIESELELPEDLSQE